MFDLNLRVYSPVAFAFLLLLKYVPLFNIHVYTRTRTCSNMSDRLLAFHY